MAHDLARRIIAQARCNGLVVDKPLMSQEQSSASDEKSATNGSSKALLARDVLVDTRTSVDADSSGTLPYGRIWKWAIHIRHRRDDTFQTWVQRDCS